MHLMNKMYEFYSNTPGACYAKEVEMVNDARVCSLGGRASTLLHLNRERTVYISVSVACGVIVLSNEATRPALFSESLITLRI